MRIFRQLGSCGTILLLGPLLWIAACFLGRALAQNAYDHQITASTRAYRIPESPVPAQGLSVSDRLALTELQKYLRVWNLEPGACAAFPDAARFPWSWNPLNGTAVMLRLKQKQAYLNSQHHQVRRQRLGSARWRYFLQPDPGAALGARAFTVDASGDTLEQAWEWK